MLYIVVAVLIILIVMNLFMVTVLRQMTLSTGKQIEKDAIRLFSAYDEVLEKKSLELQKLEQELEEKRQEEKLGETMPVQAVSQASAGEACVVSGRYRDDTFSDDYQRVKENFSFDPTLVLDHIQRQIPDSRKELALVEGILGKLSFEDCYEMMTLPTKDQNEILDEFLTEDEKKLHHSYMEASGDEEVQAFYQWLTDRRRILDTGMELRVGVSLKDRAKELETQVASSYDPEICEGFQVKAGNRIYDYSI